MNSNLENHKKIIAPTLLAAIMIIIAWRFQISQSNQNPLLVPMPRSHFPAEWITQLECTGVIGRSENQGPRLSGLEVEGGYYCAIPDPDFWNASQKITADEIDRSGRGDFWTRLIADFRP